MIVVDSVLMRGMLGDSGARVNSDDGDDMDSMDNGDGGNGDRDEDR